jgi:hypothetical protein
MRNVDTRDESTSEYILFAFLDKFRANEKIRLMSYEQCVEALSTQVARTIDSWMW